MGGGKTWTTEENDFLRENYQTMSHEEMTRHLPNRTRFAVKCRCLKAGFVIVKFKWTAEKNAELKNRYADTKTAILAEDFGCSEYTIYQKAYALGLKKSEEFLKSDECGRLTKTNNLAGAAFRFKKGQKAWNKGKKMPTVGRMAETQFKKGTLPHNTAKIGDESIIDGYVKVKIAEPNVWKWKHRMIWEQHHGEIPKGFAVIFKDGNRDNCLLENLECVTPKELYRRNSIHNLPEELKQTIQTLGRLKRAINRSNKNAEK